MSGDIYDNDDDRIVQISTVQIDLRDWFAGQALAGRAGNGFTAQQSAVDAYRIADSMMQVRDND